MGSWDAFNDVAVDGEWGSYSVFGAFARVSAYIYTERSYARAHCTYIRMRIQILMGRTYTRALTTAGYMLAQLNRYQWLFEHITLTIASVCSIYSCQ